MFTKALVDILSIIVCQITCNHHLEANNHDDNGSNQSNLVMEIILACQPLCH